LATYYQLTTRRPTKGALAWLNRLVGDWGDERVSRALALEWIESTDSSTLLSRTEALIASTAAAAQTDRRDAANARLLAEHRKLIEAPPPTNTAGMASLKRVLEEKGLS
jgi:predicted metal-dependent HD superfamily phosphohydrolase